MRGVRSMFILPEYHTSTTYQYLVRVLGTGGVLLQDVAI